MVRVNFSTKMVDIMMGCGNKTKCKDLVDYFTNLTNQPMKGNGETTDFQAEEQSTTNNLNKLDKD